MEMNDKEKKITEEIGKTFIDFRQDESIDTNLFLITRIKAELNSNKNESISLFSSIKEKMLPTLLCILILVNAVSLVFYLHDDNIIGSTKTNNISTFAQQYSLSTSNNDFLENLVKGE